MQHHQYNRQAVLGTSCGTHSGPPFSDDGKNKTVNYNPTDRSGFKEFKIYLNFSLLFLSVKFRKSVSLLQKALCIDQPYTLTR